MKVIVFGASGGTGRMIVAEAIAAGHAVTAFVRNGTPLAPTPQLTFVEGDVFDSVSVDRAIAGRDAVISALGGKPFKALNICSRAMTQIIPVMERHGVKRLVAMSTFGAGETRKDVGWLTEHVLFGFVLRGEVADKEEMER